MRTLVTVAVLAATLTPALAHFPKGSPIEWNAWAMRQWNLAGNRCCDDADSYIYEGAYEYLYDQYERVTGVRLTINGQTVVVEARRFVDHKSAGRAEDENPTGFPVVWYHNLDNVYCWDEPGTLV